MKWDRFRGEKRCGLCARAIAPQEVVAVYAHHLLRCETCMKADGITPPDVPMLLDPPEPRLQATVTKMADFRAKQANDASASCDLCHGTLWLKTQRGVVRCSCFARRQVESEFADFSDVPFAD